MKHVKGACNNISAEHYLVLSWLQYYLLYSRQSITTNLPFSVGLSR